MRARISGALPPRRPRAGFPRVLPQRFVRLQIGPLGEFRPYETHRIRTAAAPIVLLSRELAEPGIGSVRECLQSLFRPEECIVMLPSFAIGFSDSQVARGTGQVSAHHRYKFFDIARRARQRFHEVRDTKMPAPFGSLLLGRARAQICPLNVNCPMESITSSTPRAQPEASR